MQQWCVELLHHVTSQKLAQGKPKISITELQNGKNTVKTQLYLLAMRGWIT